MRKSTDFRTDLISSYKSALYFCSHFGTKAQKMLRIVPNPEHFSSVFYPARAHASFTAVPLAMTAGAPSVMLIVA